MFDVKWAWCGKVIKQGEEENSHGVCDICKDDLILKSEVEKRVKSIQQKLIEAERTFKQALVDITISCEKAMKVLKGDENV